MSRSVGFLRDHAAGLGGAVLALAVVGPMLAPGFTLVYDMVFVPQPHWSPALLGISPAYPRAVPTQLLVNLASNAIAASVVQKAILLFAFGGAAAGAARLLEGYAIPARLAGGVLYAWNPMTYERLVLGQWALLLGYAILPWAVGAARSYRRRTRGSAARLVLAVAALTASSPYLGIIGGATALAVAFVPPPDVRPPDGAMRARPPRRPTRRALLVVAGVVAVSLPWLTPTILHPRIPDHAGLSLDLFGAAADAPLGTLGSVLSLGGVWRTDLAPPGRGTLAWLPAFALILGLAVWGWRTTGPPWSRGARRGLLAAAAAGLALAIAPLLPGVHAAVVWLVDASPGGGFLRDSQKFAIPFALAMSVGFGSGVQALSERLPAHDRLLRGLSLAVVVLPVALAPTLGWGAGGRLHTASYPASWSEVQRVTSQDPSGGGILVLPWHAYLPFGWNGDQTVHDPAPLYFSRPVVSAGALEFGNAIVPGEDPWSRSADAAVTQPGPLTPRLDGLRVRYVLLFKEGAWRTLLPKVVGLQRVVEAPDLALYRGTGTGPVPSLPQPPAAPVIAGDVIALLVVVAATIAASARRVRT